MPFVAANYADNADAPEGSWVCTRTSSLGPFKSVPPNANRHSPDFCGQCVSYVTTVCDGIPVNTNEWNKGARVRGDKTIAQGTAIATFDASGTYRGHAAIYVSQDEGGIDVYDQWVTGTGKAVGPRKLRWGALGVSNNGDGFYVVEKR